MTAEIPLHTRGGSHWRRGLGPLARRENRRWWRSRRWWIQLLIWTVLLDGALAFGLFVLPLMAEADGMPITTAESIDIGRQMFFGLGVLGAALGAIVLLQDAVIEPRSTGALAWVLSKPVARPAFLLAKLLPNLAAMVICMVLVPGAIGFGLFALGAPDAITPRAFLAAQGLVALNLVFYTTLTILLGVLFTSRPPVMGIALASLFGGSFIPVPQIVQLTPWKLGEIAILVAGAQSLPPFAVTMIASTAVWSALFIAAAWWRFNRVEL